MMHGMTTAVEQVTWVPTADTFAIRLSMVRNRMGWNAKEAALACGLPQGSWREWELFNRQPRDLAGVADQIAARTGVDDYWLMTGRTKGEHPSGPEGCAIRDSNPEPADTGSPQVARHLRVVPDLAEPGDVEPLSPVVSGAAPDADPVAA